jgi:tetratricopeptide (TPR) repeat protein
MLKGSIDRAEAQSVEGWAQDPGQPEVPISLLITDNNRLLGRVLANGYRRDLEEAGLGSGRHAFQLKFMRPLSVHETHIIRVRRESDGAELDGSPIRLEPATVFDDGAARRLAEFLEEPGSAEELERKIEFLAVESGKLVQQLADRQTGRAERRQYRDFLRRWSAQAPAAATLSAPRAPAPRALVIDERIPAADRDAGSQAILSHMRSLQRLGYAVSFAPALALSEAANGEEDGLAAMGVTLCRPPFYASVEEVLLRQASGIELVYLHRLSNAAKYTTLVRHHCPKARLVFSVADLHHLRLARQAEVEKRPELAAQSKRLRVTELRAASLVDAVITHSETEAELLRKHVRPGAVHVLPWSMTMRPTTVSFAERRGIAFIGSYGHKPNLAAARRLVDEIMPLVHAKDPGIECLLVGSDMPEELSKLSAPGILPIGRVEDLAEIFARVRLTVAPLAFGAGIKGKVLESLRAGVPCVCTPIAAEGLALPPELQEQVAESNEALAAAILRMHDDEAVNARCSRAGLDYIEAGFSEEKLDALMRRAVAPAVGAPSVAADASEAGESVARLEEDVVNGAAAEAPSSPFADALALAEARYKAGAYREAAEIYTQLAEQYPDRAAPLHLLGLCRMRLDDAPGALPLFEKACKLAPRDVQAKLHYGLGLHALKRDREAAAIFRACQPLLPADPAPCLNLAAALLALGDSRGAVTAARKAKLRGRKMPQTHYMFGLAKLACGDLVQAEAGFRAALKLNANFADAWVNLGLVRYRQNDMGSAVGAMRRALDADPTHRAATANLGGFLRLTGQGMEGEKLLRALVERDPAANEARLNLAAELLLEERTKEALALLDGVPLPAEPGLRRHWRTQRVLALLQSRRYEEARTTLDEIGEPPPALRPLILWRRLLLATAERKPDEARVLAGEMETALEAPAPILPEHRIMGNFDLGWFWSRQGDQARAIQLWGRGHKLLGRIQPFSRDAYRRFIDTTIEAFGRARFETGPRAGNADAAPIFIVGMPRSGTTLTEQIIAAHPQAHGAGERVELAATFAQLGGAPETPEAIAKVTSLDGPALDKAAETYLATLHGLAPEATRIVDKMPGNFRYLGLIGLLLPGARIIHCVRDPRDIGLSIFTFRFFGYHPYAHDLGDLGWYIAEHDRLMAHWRAAMPNPIFTVGLEDWVKDFDATLRRLLEFLDLPYDAACERFYERDSKVRTVSRKQVRQPINARGLGRWRAYERELEPLIAELAAAGALPAA